MRDFRMSYSEAITFPLARALALRAYATLHNQWTEMEIEGEGYLSQERMAKHL